MQHSLQESLQESIQESLQEPSQQALMPAPLWRRLAAMLYDSFLVLSLSFMVGFINLAIQMKIYGPEPLKQMTENGHSLGGPAFYLSLLLTLFSFFSFFWTRNGQTLGMQAWRLVILDKSGRTITMKKALLRFLVAIPSLLLGLLGVLWVLWDKEKRSWQDHASDSDTYHWPTRKKR